VVTDQFSDLLLTTSPEAADNLAREGVDPSRIFFVGNPMIDTLLSHLDAFDPARVLPPLGIDGDFGVVTIHRPSNVDDPASASALVQALSTASEVLPLVIPLHPRGRCALAEHGLMEAPAVTVIEPLGYLDFMSLVKGARAVITDSGGVQEETTVLDVPCLTLRPNTERPITISHGTNRLVSSAGLATSLFDALHEGHHAAAAGPPLWDGHAGERIALVIDEWMARR